MFDLEPLEEVPYYGSVVNDGDDDADGDGEPNATDLCALIPATEPGGRSDRDGDGVGDLCDPDPDQPGNCLALFDSFAAPTLSPHWRFDGEAVEVDGKLVIPGGDETIVYLDTELSLQTIEVQGYIHIGANAGGARHAIQVLPDATLTPLVSGRGCSFESNTTTSQITAIEVVAGVDTSRGSNVVGDLLVGAGTNVDSLSWIGEGPLCRVSASDASRSQGEQVLGVAPTRGVFALRVLDAGFWMYAVAGYGKGC